MHSASHSSPAPRSGARVDVAFAGLARFVVRFRVLVVVFWLVVAVVSTSALPSLGSEVDNDNSAFLPPSAKSSRAATLAAPLLGSAGRTSQIVIIASRSGAPLTPADDAAIARELRAARQVKRITSARVLGVSADGQAAQLRIRASINRQDVSAAKTVVADLEGTFARAAAPPGLRLHLAGQVATLVANQTSSNRSGERVQRFSVLFIVVLLLLVFRSPLAAIVTLLPSALALAISTRFIGGLGAEGLKISSITQVLLIVLLLGAGTDYGLFLVFRTREELRAGRSPHDAVMHALLRVGESISASAGTVAAALLTLLLASFGLYHDLGVPLALGIAVMLLLGLTLLPALLAIFGKRVFWPVRVEPGPVREGLWGRVARRSVRRPRITLAIGVAVFLALAAGALGYRSSGFGGATTAPSGSDAAAGNATLAAHFPQSSTNPANLVFEYRAPLWNDPTVVARASRSLRSSHQFAALTGPLNPSVGSLSPTAYAQLHARLGPAGRLPIVEPAALGVPRRAYQVYRASTEFVSGDGTVIQFEAALAAGAQQSTQAMNATPRIRAVVSRAASASGAAASGVAGQAAATYDISTTANRDLALIIPIAALAIAILLALVLRSLVAPLYLIVSVVLSYLAALGLATLVFVDIGGDSGITFILPFLMFVFLLALGEDYNILVMTRIREEARGLALRDAVVRAIGRTGSTVTSAGLILGGTFAVLGIAGGGTDSSQLHAIGFGLAAGILMDTFLVRTLLVPAAVMLLGRWNWWPSAMSRAACEHAGLEPAVGSLPRGQAADALDAP